MPADEREYFEQLMSEYGNAFIYSHKFLNYIFASFLTPYEWEFDSNYKLCFIVKSKKV